MRDLTLRASVGSLVPGNGALVAESREEKWDTEITRAWVIRHYRLAVLTWGLLCSACVKCSPPGGAHGAHRASVRLLARLRGSYGATAILLANRLRKSTPQDQCLGHIEHAYGLSLVCLRSCGATSGDVALLGEPPKKINWDTEITRVKPG